MTEMELVYFKPAAEILKETLALTWRERLKSPSATEESHPAPQEECSTRHTNSADLALSQKEFILAAVRSTRKRKEK